MKIGTSLYKYGDGTEKAKIHIVADEGMSLTVNINEKVSQALMNF